jgi:hypothetical protein
MRSHSILRKSHLLSKLSPLHSLPIRHTWLAVDAISGNRVFSSKSSPPPPTEPHDTIQSSEPLSNNTNPVFEEQDNKPPKHRRTRISSNGKEQDSLELPDDLDILWLPADSGVTPFSTSDILPSSDMLEDPFDNLLLTLHPKNQHRAVYPSYCPLEGGHCVVDATVRELASRTGSEVLVLDAVQLAAGEWGAFGKGIFFPQFKYCIRHNYL